MDIICFANDWDGDPLSKQHIMRRLAQRGARVLWVNSLGNRAPRLGDAGDLRRAARKLARFGRALAVGPRAVEERLWVLDPIAAPAYRSPVAAALNARTVGWHVRHTARRLGFHAPIHYTFVPASAWVAGRLDESLLVYHAADEYGAFGGADRAAVEALEDRLLRRADLYLACSRPLLDGKADRCRRAELFRHGVEHAHFARALEPLPLPAGLEGLTPPVLGFVGLVAEWVDLGLLGRVADALRVRGGSLAIVGDVRGARPEAALALTRRPNVRLAGRRPYAEIPAWCRGFAAGLLPFVLDDLTRAANPLKLREYLAAGLRVVSTDLPESRALAERIASSAPGAMVVARDSDAFVDAAVAAAHARDAGPNAVRSAAVAEESWDGRVDDLERMLKELRPQMKRA